MRVGVSRVEKVALDPGLGFAKTADHNWEILRRLDVLDTLGLISSSFGQWWGATPAEGGEFAEPGFVLEFFGELFETVLGIRITADGGQVATFDQV